MKISRRKTKAPDKTKRNKKASNRAKFNLKNFLKKEISQREKLLQKDSRASQEYCEKCAYSTICYNNIDRKEFRRLHGEHKLRLDKKLYAFLKGGLICRVQNIH